MEQNKNDYWNQLLLLKGLTDLTGALHEAQVLQLKMWGLIAFEKVPKKDLVINVDLAEKSVIYLLPPKNDTKKRLLSSLTKSIQDMLGENWALTVKSGDKVIYRSQLDMKEVNAPKRSRNRANRKKSKSKRS